MCFRQQPNDWQPPPLLLQLETDHNVWCGIITGTEGSLQGVWLSCACMAAPPLQAAFLPPLLLTHSNCFRPLWF